MVLWIQQMNDFSLFFCIFFPVVPSFVLFVPLSFPTSPTIRIQISLPFDPRRPNLMIFYDTFRKSSPSHGRSLPTFSASPLDKRFSAKRFVFFASSPRRSCRIGSLIYVAANFGSRLIIRRVHHQREIDLKFIFIDPRRWPPSCLPKR